MKSNGKVFTVPADLYARWRTECLAVATLRENEPSSPPTERLLQQVWLHQRLRRDALRTLDGRAVTVLHPGFWNRETGPDFRQAIIQWGDQPARIGDVEVDVSPRGWRHHHHSEDPAYQNVLLHVVWEQETPALTALPTVALREVLDAPLEELRHWLGGDGQNLPPAVQPGACATPLQNLPPPLTEGLLLQAARTRLEQKAAGFRARARQAGWTQALWEGLFGALGYKHNVWPMRRLAELMPRLRPRGEKAPVGVLDLQAQLLGLSGLLPSDLTHLEAGTAAYVRRLWDDWWREREILADAILPRAAWRFHGLRPANHPCRRLALAAHWLADPAWPERLGHWITEETPDAALARSLLECLQVERDDFWSRHWTLRSANLERPQPLLGAQRLTDLAMNVVLPWFWSRAVAGRNTALRGRVEHRYFAWPPGQENATLRLARQRLNGTAPLPVPRTAAMQQGLLQIARDFCDHSNALCAECEFPDLVQGLGRSGGQGVAVDVP